MKVQIVKRRSKAIAAFNDREWPKADLEHYGAVEPWDENEFRIVASDKKEILGTLHLTIKRGVCEINALIVSDAARGMGVGTTLMQKAEDLARSKNVHKIYLETGKGWKAEAFYQKIGYTVNTIMPNHYFGKDFVLYEKMIH
jgi:GNAT superfamily N-acetyltransferase